MKRALSFALAAALLATPMAASVAPAGEMNGNIVLAGSNWHGQEHFRNNDNDNWRWRHRNRHHRRNHDSGFSFNFGAPFPFAFYAPRSRDCFRDRWGRLYCRSY